MQTAYIVYISVHISRLFKVLQSYLLLLTWKAGIMGTLSLPAFQAPALSCDGELGASPVQMTKNFHSAWRLGQVLQYNLEFPSCEGAGCVAALEQPLPQHCGRGSVPEHHGELPQPDALLASKLLGEALPLPPASARALWVSLANLKNSAYMFIS